MGQNSRCTKETVLLLPLMFYMWHDSDIIIVTIQLVVISNMKISFWDCSHNEQILQWITPLKASSIQIKMAIWLVREVWFCRYRGKSRIMSINLCQVYVINVPQNLILFHKWLSCIFIKWHPLQHITININVVAIYNEYTFPHNTKISCQTVWI